MIIINPRTIKNTASTKTIKIIFSFGFTNTSRLHLSDEGKTNSSSFLISTNRTDLGIIGVHFFNTLVPLVGTATVNYSMKLLLLPIPI